MNKTNILSFGFLTFRVDRRSSLKTFFFNNLTGRQKKTNIDSSDAQKYIFWSFSSDSRH